jgi:hypothetical protein
MVRRTQYLPSGRLKKRLWRSRKDFSMSRRAMRTHFLHHGEKKLLRRIRLFDVLCRRMDFWTHNLPSLRLTNGVWWCRWSKVSMCLKAIRTPFQHPKHRKNRLGRRRLSVILIRPIGLSTNNLQSGRIKKRLWWSRWSDISRCRKAIRIHFLHPVHRKKRLGRIRLWCFM